MIKIRSRIPDLRHGMLIGVLLAVFLTGSIVSLQAHGKLTPSGIGQEKLYVPSGRFLRESAVGFRELVADYYWFQTVQYYGGFRKGEHDLRYFKGLVDAVLLLDPLFVEGYYFSALVLAMDLGDRDGAIDFLKRGIHNNPDRWILPFELGFIHYIFTNDFPRASVWFDEAARCFDATDFTRRFAAFCHKRAGDLEVSIELWQNLHATTINPHMKQLAATMIERCRAQLEERTHRSPEDL